MLCSACQRIFRGQWIFNDKGYGKHEIHHMTAQSFTHAISQKCYIRTSMLQQYQANRRGTFGGPLQLADVLRASEYYFSRKKSQGRHFFFKTLGSLVRVTLERKIHLI